MKNSIMINHAIVPLYERIQENLPEESEYAAQADELLYGMEAEVLQEENDWIYVCAFYNYKGWMKKKAAIPKRPWMAEKRLAMIHKSYADILSVPKVQGKILQSIPRGGLLIWLGDAGVDGWSLVQLLDGRRGFVKESAICPWKLRQWKAEGRAVIKEENHLRYSLAETAKTYLGTQYRWGGKTPLGIDCSGFCSMVYLSHGIIIYRDARIQEGFPVREISFRQIRPGDLLYYPGHMALYLGDEHYIHSTGRTGSDGVVINSLNRRDSDYREDLAKPQVGSIF